MKFFTEGFGNLLSSFSFNSENLLPSIGQCTWVHLYFPFGKLRLDIHNKMADNNGTALPHETDFDISTKTVFVELISGDLKTINCHISLLDYYLR